MNCAVIVVFEFRCWFSHCSRTRTGKLCSPLHCLTCLLIGLVACWQVPRVDCCEPLTIVGVTVCMCWLCGVVCSVAWSGGEMVTNKTEALRKFIARKGGLNALSKEQRALVQHAQTSHTKLAIPVQIVPTAVLSGQAPSNTTNSTAATVTSGGGGSNLGKRKSQHHTHQTRAVTHVPAGDDDDEDDDVYEDVTVTVPAGKRRVVMGGASNFNNKPAPVRIPLVTQNKQQQQQQQQRHHSGPKQVSQGGKVKKPKVTKPIKPTPPAPTLSLGDKLSLPLEQLVKRK